MNKSIVVYCASSSKIDEAFLASARELGRLMARQGVALIDGGGKTGLMGAVNDGCIEAGGCSYLTRQHKELPSNLASGKY